MLFTRQKEREDENQESTPRTQTEINIRAVRTPNRTVFTQEYNELFVQQVLQYSQDLEVEVLHYDVICLDESSTEDDLEKAYRKLALRSHPDKNKHPQASADFLMINEAKQGLKKVLCHNDAMRRNQERGVDIQRQEEYWRDKEKIMIAQEESEEPKK